MITGWNHSITGWNIASIHIGYLHLSFIFGLFFNFSYFAIKHSIVIGVIVFRFISDEFVYKNFLSLSSIDFEGSIEKNHAGLTELKSIPIEPREWVSCTVHGYLIPHILCDIVKVFIPSSKLGSNPEMLKSFIRIWLLKWMIWIA